MKHFRDAIIIFIFAIFSGIARFFLSEYIPTIGHFPIATLLINFIGTFFLIFFVKSYFEVRKVDERILLGLGTGFAGAFTTFSSAMLDTAKLVEIHDYSGATLYMVLTIFGGLLFAQVAYSLSNRLEEKIEEDNQ